jgi:hypothetical protein
MSISGSEINSAAVLWQSVRLSLAPRLLEIVSRECDDAHDVIGFEIADIDVADIADTKDANFKRFHRR